MMELLLDKEENIVGKGENAGYHLVTSIFSFSHYAFKGLPHQGSLPFTKQTLVFMCLLYESFENTGGKGEIACNKQFLLFPQCFQKACFPGASKGVIVWEWVKNIMG